MILNWLLFISGLGLIVLASNMLVRSLATISRFLRLSEFFVSFLMMAFATSIPELAVGLMSAATGRSQLVLGNTIGSNIADLTLVLGIVALVGRSMPIGGVMRKDILEMSAVSLLLVGLAMLGGSVSRLDGLLLVAAFGLYTWNLSRTGRLPKRRLEDGVSPVAAVLDSGLFVVSVLLLFLASGLVVDNASAISSDLGIPELLVGLIIVSIGTSLPEIFFESVAVSSRHPEMSIGDLVGSVVVNSTLVIGISALIRPIPVEFRTFISPAVFFILSSVLFFVFAESDRKITWTEGVALVLFYVLFLVVELQARGVFG